MFGRKLEELSNFHPFDVVSRGTGSETQLQLGENLNNLT